MWGRPGPAVEPKRKVGPLVALIGVGAAAIATPLVTQWEGTRYVTYLDVVGIPTACTGDTNNVGPVGTKHTPEECRDRLERQLVAHAKPVVQCTPGLGDYQKAAAVSLAYNIGTAGYCRSTVARRFNAGDWSGACDAFLMWTKAGGRQIQGLVNRRKAERRLCYAELPADKIGADF